MFQFLPMAIGAGAGLLTNKDPLQGALQGAALGGITGGLGGAAAPGAAGAAGGLGLQAPAAGLSAVAGAPPGIMAGATGTGLLGGSLGAGATSGAPSMTMGVGNGVQLSQAGTPTASGLAGIFNKDNLQAAGNVAGLAAQMGVFDGPQQPPAAPSAGIPARQADFSGLLSAGRSNNTAGAQRLMQQQMARKQGRL